MKTLLLLIPFFLLAALGSNAQNAPTEKQKIVPNRQLQGVSATRSIDNKTNVSENKNTHNQAKQEATKQEEIEPSQRIKGIEPQPSYTGYKRSKRKFGK